MMRGSLGWSLGCLLLALSGCATVPAPRTERVVLLPHADGTPSAIMITGAAGEILLDHAFAEVDVSSAALKTTQLTESVVRQRYAVELQALPRRPAHYSLFFDLNTDRLTSDSKGRFDMAVRDIVTFPAGEAIVIGHADRSGSPEYNLTLSIRRAEAIRKMLIEAGMEAKRIQIVGKSDLEPAVASSARGIEPRNRRVEIELR